MNKSNEVYLQLALFGLKEMSSEAWVSASTDEVHLLIFNLQGDPSLPSYSNIPINFSYMHIV